MFFIGTGEICNNNATIFGAAKPREILSRAKAFEASQ